MDKEQRENRPPVDAAEDTDDPQEQHPRSPQHGEEQGREVPGFNDQGYAKTPDATDPSKD